MELTAAEYNNPATSRVVKKRCINLLCATHPGATLTISQMREYLTRNQETIDDVIKAMRIDGQMKCSVERELLVLGGIIPQGE